MEHFHLPSLPAQISGTKVWFGQQFADKPELYVQHLSQNDIKELEDAANHFESLNLARGQITPDTFPLSTDLARRLRRITEDVYDGKGFSVLRGIDTLRYSEDTRVIMFAGLTSYVASDRANNINHIRDMTHRNPHKDRLNPLERSVAMGFHTDCDSPSMLSMFFQTLPEQGGEQFLSSIATAYNELALTDPKVLETLSQDWYWEKVWRTDLDKEEVRTYHRPLISFEDGTLHVHFAAAFIGANPQEVRLSDNAPPLNPEQLHALESVLAVLQRNAVQIDPCQGDLVFVNNYAVLHARAGWVDSQTDPLKSRYMMRLHLHDKDKGWKPAAALQVHNEESFNVPVEKRKLFTGEEWNKLPRAWRVQQMGVTSTVDHD